MGQLSTQAKLILANVLLFSVVVITAYLQTVFHFNTYLALVICLVDTIVCAMILFKRWE